MSNIEETKARILDEVMNFEDDRRESDHYNCSTIKHCTRAGPTAIG